MKIFKPTWIHHDGHPIFSIDIHPDDIHFATGGQGDANTGRVVIWNLKAVLQNKDDKTIPKLFCQLDHHSACVNCVRWSNSGRYLASGGDDKVIIIWKLVSKYSGSSQINPGFEKNNLEIWKTVSILRSHEGDVLDLAWSPGDTYLASCSIDNSVKIWDAQHFPQLITTLEGHSSMVKGVTWDPIGKYIATQSVDRTLRIWRTSDWTTEHIVKEPFTDCGGTTHVLRLGWSPDGLYLVSAHAMNYGFPTAQIIERDGWKVDKDFVGHRKAVVCVRFSKNIQEINRVKQCCVAIGSRDKSISVWSTALQRPVVVIKEAFSHSVMDITWSHCGTIMMACSWDGSVLAAQFKGQEIGKPLSQEETDTVYQRFYGESIVSSNTAMNVIPNMEVFLARSKISHEKKEMKSTVELNSIPERAQIPVEQVETVNKGPTKQIETRTVDGKRRITPKFLPLPNDDMFQSTVREEPLVFQQNDGSCIQKEDNLRERMVSSIDDVSFGDGKHLGDKNLPLSQNEAAMTNYPSEKTEEPPQLVNGFHNSRSNPEQQNDEEKLKPLAQDINGNCHEHNSKSKTSDGETSTPSLALPLPNGTGDGDKTSEQKGSPTTSQKMDVSLNQNGEKLKKVSPVNEEPINVLQVKRKRPGEEMKPPIQNSKKKFTPQSLRTFPPRKSNKIGMDEPVIENTASSTRSPVVSKPVCSPKFRLPPLKIDSVFTVQINIKPESAYTLEVTNNHKRADGLCHQLKCQHFPTSMQGLQWIICTDSPLCAISGDIHRIIALCEDATVHILDLKGRYALSPILLSSYPSKLVQNGPFLLVITTKAFLHIWNIHNKTVAIKSESLLPLLNQPGNNESGEKAIDITHAYLAAGGVPVIFLSNGKSFIFNKEMSSWMLFADIRGLVSSPIMPDAGDLASVISIAKLGGRRRKPEPSVISHIKLQLIKATELKKRDSIQQWVVVLAKTLATHGLDKELHVLCEDLLGPTHSSANSAVSWMPKIADCVDKRTMLREILNNLLEDLRWQDLFCEFDDLLKELDRSGLPA